MDVVIKGIGEGKTRDLIMKAHEDGGLIVCATRAMVAHTVAIAESLGITIQKPITWSEHIHNQHSGVIQAFQDIHIDDMDYILRLLLPKSNIKTVTFSK